MPPMTLSGHEETLDELGRTVDNPPLVCGGSMADSLAYSRYPLPARAYVALSAFG